MEFSFRFQSEKEFLFLGSFAFLFFEGLFCFFFVTFFRLDICDIHTAALFAPDEETRFHHQHCQLHRMQRSASFPWKKCHKKRNNKFITRCLDVKSPFCFSVTLAWIPISTRRRKKNKNTRILVDAFLICGNCGMCSLPFLRLTCSQTDRGLPNWAKIFVFGDLVSEAYPPTKKYFLKPKLPLEASSKIISRLIIWCCWYGAQQIFSVNFTVRAPPASPTKYSFFK